MDLSPNCGNDEPNDDSLLAPAKSIAEIIEECCQLEIDIPANIAKAKELSDKVYELCATQNDIVNCLAKFYVNDDGSQQTVNEVEQTTETVQGNICNLALKLCSYISVAEQYDAMKLPIQQLFHRIESFRTEDEDEQFYNWITLCIRTLSSTMAYCELQRGGLTKHRAQILATWDTLYFLRFHKLVAAEFGKEVVKPLVNLMNKSELQTLLEYLAKHPTDTCCKIFQLIIDASSSKFDRAIELLHSLPPTHYPDVISYCWAVIGLHQSFVGLQKFAAASFAKAISAAKYKTHAIRCLQIAGYLHLDQLGLTCVWSEAEIEELNPDTYKTVDRNTTNNKNNCVRRMLLMQQLSVLCRCAGCVTIEAYSQEDRIFPRLLAAVIAFYQTASHIPLFLGKYVLDTVYGVGRKNDSLKNSLLASNMGTIVKCRDLQHIYELVQIRRRFGNPLARLFNNTTCTKWVETQLCYHDAADFRQLVNQLKAEAWITLELEDTTTPEDPHSRPTVSPEAQKKAKDAVNEALRHWNTGFMLRELISIKLKVDGFKHAIV